MKDPHDVRFVERRGSHERGHPVHVLSVERRTSSHQLNHESLITTCGACEQRRVLELIAERVGITVCDEAKHLRPSVASDGVEDALRLVLRRLACRHRAQMGDGAETCRRGTPSHLESQGRLRVNWGSLTNEE